LRLNKIIPRAGVLQEVHLTRALRRVLSFELKIPCPWRAAIRMGSAGPRQKASILLTSAEGDGIAFAKVAMTPAADARVIAEAENLHRLRDVKTLAGRVPNLIAHGRTLGGRRYLLTSIAPSTRRKHRLMPAHVFFLRVLGRARLDEYAFSASPCLRRLETMLALLQPCADRATRLALWSAVRDCVMQLSDWKGPFVLAQGDFAPWNVCLHERSVFVVNWEKAREGANPVSDLLHFLVVSNLSAGPLGNRALIATIRNVCVHMRAFYPEWQWSYRVVAALTLAWLIEMLVQRCIETECFDGADPLIRSHWRLIESRSGWLTLF
jgi:hypothetical protein